MKKYSIDIHAHTTLKPFTHNYPDKPSEIWNALSNTCTGISQPVLQIFENSVLRGTQTALEQAAEGNVKIIGVSLFTYEDGWIKGAAKSIISCLAGPSKQKLNDIFQAKEDIYKNLTNEFNYLVEQTQKEYTDKKGDTWTIKFLTRDILNKIASNDQILDTENTIYLFVNIEGIQTLGIPSANEDTPYDQYPDKLTNDIRTRINEIKNTWVAMPQFITFCHHFGNMLAGHARTIPPFLNDVLNIDQNRFLYKGINKNGKKILFEILGDKQRRILIDIKHFSAQARKDYYQYLEDTFPDENIPVICSHTGFINKYTTLDQLILQVDDGSDLRNEYLLNWTINLCKEDLEVIQKSNGLIGIQTDLKRLVGKKYHKAIKKMSGNDASKMSCEIVWANIFTAISCLNNKAAWDLLCIGSDYDGIVSYLPGYPTFAEYPKLKVDLVTSLTNKSFQYIHNININGKFLDNTEIDRLMFGYTPLELVDKIFSTNALHFWKKHFLDQKIQIPL